MSVDALHARHSAASAGAPPYPSAGSDSGSFARRAATGAHHAAGRRFTAMPDLPSPRAPLLRGRPGGDAPAAPRDGARRRFAPARPLAPPTAGVSRHVAPRSPVPARMVATAAHPHRVPAAVVAHARGPHRVPAAVAVRAGTPHRVPTSIAVVQHEPRERYVELVKGASGAVRKIDVNAQAHFQGIKQATFQHLVRTGRLQAGQVHQFKMFVWYDGTAQWSCGTQRGAIDFHDSSAGWDRLTHLHYHLDRFRAKLSTKAPNSLGRHMPQYRSGYLGDIASRNGFSVRHRDTARHLPGTMGAFCDGHLERAMGSRATVRDYYTRMAEMATMDAYRKAAVKGIKAEIKKIEREIARLEHIPHHHDRVEELQADHHRLNRLRQNFEASDQFAVNFALCFRPSGRARTNIDRAYELSAAAKRHLKETEGVLPVKERKMFGANKLADDLHREDREYCDFLGGSFMLHDRAEEFVPYCKQRGIAYGNSAIERNFLMGNLRALQAGSPHLQGMEMFEGIDPAIVARIQRTITQDGRDKAFDIQRRCRSRLGQVGRMPLSAKQAVEDFKAHIYGAGWQ